MFLFCTSGTVLPSVAGIYFISDYLLQKMENRRKKLQSRTILEHISQKVGTNSLSVKNQGSVNHLSYGWFALKGNSIIRYSNALSVIFKCVWATTQLGDISLSPAPAIVVLKDRPHQESVSIIQVSNPVFFTVTFIPDICHFFTLSYKIHNDVFGNSQCRVSFPNPLASKYG